MYKIESFGAAKTLLLRSSYSSSEVNGNQPEVNGSWLEMIENWSEVTINQPEVAQNWMEIDRKWSKTTGNRPDIDN